MYSHFPIFETRAIPIKDYTAALFKLYLYIRYLQITKTGNKKKTEKERKVCLPYIEPKEKENTPASQQFCIV